MLDAWIWGTLTLTFGLLSSLQGVSANKTANTCDILSCPKGFTCCDNECCPERKVWDSANNPFRILSIIICTILPVLFICALVRCIYSKCRDLQHDVRTSDHRAPPEPPSIAPLESIRVTSFDPPPRYSQLGLSITIPNVFHSWWSDMSK
ncbi:transmembrane protein 92-like [Mus musculus]|uniref:transmembrane protein 92-like n=1 Tax=Mus musculus TaxID=10090 RepID=UPI00015532F6|nr:transmembrane protein 92-like [Mus musculus]|eukprot:XP_006534667.1 PREDICTED: transmembrane protein 92-like [Mus musculus]